jgi:hypothetical protein
MTDLTIRFRVSRSEARDLLDRTTNDSRLIDRLLEALEAGTNALEVGDLLLTALEELQDADRDEADAWDERSREFEFERSQGRS